MGQKVNPHGMRVGVIKDWDSRWFTSKQAFGDTLVEDHKIRKTLKKQLYAAGVPKIEIERTVDSQSGAALDELLRKSDLALYKAKNNGKSQCFVYVPADDGDAALRPAKNLL